MRIPAKWMAATVADGPNNWVQVRRDGAAFVASVGKETFDVELKIGLSAGEILSARLDNSSKPWRATVSTPSSPTVAIHVRIGRSGRSS